MEEFRFPFPGRELADKELTYDPCYEKIPEADRSVIVEKAWQKGCRAAEMVFSREGGTFDFHIIARNSGLKLMEIPKDYIVGKQRYFSDYISGQNLINLYSGSIQKWAEQNELEYADAVILLRIAVADRRRRISAAIINQQQFPIGKSLSQHTFNTLTQVFFRLIDGYNNRNTGHNATPLFHFWTYVFLFYPNCKTRSSFDPPLCTLIVENLQIPEYSYIKEHRREFQP